MRNSKLSACHHPTTVVFIDDNRKYLTNLRFELDETKFSPKLYFSPMDALHFLQNEYQPNPFTTKCLTRPEESRFDHRNIEIDISAIRKEIYNTQRFDEISVIIVDYAMPTLNGLDLCLQLKHAPYKKLMLTGEAEEGIAIQAFNDGIIDKFVRKDIENFSFVINSTIQELQSQYFAELSQIIIDSLTKDRNHPIITWLDEPPFIELFDSIQEQNDITEYYLADAFGSFIFLDFEGNPSWLAVKSEDEMQAAMEVAEGSDTPFPNEILTSMKKREKVLYMFQKGGLSDDLEEVKRSLHPATKLKGRKTNYFYSLIKNPNAYEVDFERILSYKSYLERLKDLRGYNEM